jgi:nitrogenase molybdenum-iron protein NifN
MDTLKNIDTMLNGNKSEATSTRNGCKVCSPLGASVAYKGIKGCVPLIHGSQGCATYIRRYLISHYKEPVDIASSNFSQETAIFGGAKNFEASINNIIKQYNPEVIGIASTCLSETIGEDMKMMIHDYLKNHIGETIPSLVYASTPSYQGTHMDGFHEAVTSIVQAFAEGRHNRDHINIFPGFISPEDIRYLKEILSDFYLDYIMLPDYSDTLDSGIWEEYHRIPPGGTPLSRVKLAGSALASIELGNVFNSAKNIGRVKVGVSQPTAASYLQERFRVERLQTSMPIGIRATDKFFEILEEVSLYPALEKYTQERERLVDSYIDGHKYVFGKRAIVYGEEDFVISMVSFLQEIGIKTILAVSGGESGKMKNILQQTTEVDIETLEGGDFEQMATFARENKPDLLIGNSKGYYIARELNIPLIRAGFPIHDRIGGQRILHLGYRGTQQLFDKIVNALLEYKQDHSPVGYKYM